MACGPDLLHISLASPALSSLLESGNRKSVDLKIEFYRRLGISTFWSLFGGIHSGTYNQIVKFIGSLILGNDSEVIFFVFSAAVLSLLFSSVL